MPNKSLLTYLGEAVDTYRANRHNQTNTTVTDVKPHRTHWLRWLLPTPGNVIFTLLVIGSLLWAQNVGAINLAAPNAAALSTGTIAYQGRLANTNGQPVTNTVNMSFRLYAVVGGGAPLWEEQWTGANSVQVSDGLFNVMLGSLTPIPQAVITGNSNLFLGITVGTDGEMSPRVQLGSVPFAVQALTVPDGSITSAKLADGAITQSKAPFAVEHFVGTISAPNSKVSTGTYTFPLDGGSQTEFVDIDVTALNFNKTPIGIAQVVDGFFTTFASYTWDGSTKSKARIRFFRIDGQNLSSQWIRVHLILWND